MTFRLREHGIGALALDIEGTTTPMPFVYDVLFPFARARLRQYLDGHSGGDELREPIRRLRAEWMEDVARGETPPDWPDRDPTPEQHLSSMALYVEWLMDRDRKSPGLKMLQGHIWESGYLAGTLRGEVFDDVPPALQRWRIGGIGVAIFSSGSVLAQRLLFGHTRHGDLTRFIDAFFDTASGPKTSPDSYRHIAAAMQRPPERMLFVSDIVEELDAARSAGYRTLLCVRPGNVAQQGIDDFTTIDRFDEIV